MAELSPMMQQYFKVKENYKDHILFYRLGDFYEMFFEDAKIASKELELTLTGRNCGLEERAEMCGVPYHSCEAYIARLIDKGFKVAICEQTEDPSKTKTIVKREVVKVITPGTLTESSMLSETKNNYLCSVGKWADGAAVAFCDISTGEIFATEINSKDASEEIINELSKFMPKELIVNFNISSDKLIDEFNKLRLFAMVNYLEDSFALEAAENILQSQYKHCDFSDKIKSCCGALISYLFDTQKQALSNLRDITVYIGNNFMQLDYFTRRNLEITSSLRQNGKQNSLLSVIDFTSTAMGARQIRKWLEQPLCNLSAINRRQNAVAELYSNSIARNKIENALCGVRDIERLLTRVMLSSANARDLSAMLTTLERVPALKDAVSSFNSAMLTEVFENLDTMDDIVSLLKNAIVEDAPVTIKEGGLIKPKFSKEVDELRDIMSGGKAYIAALENTERESTGIKNLKISYNKVFGYSIEVTNSYKDQVPEHYIRKQTLSNCERYITEQLKQLEEKVLNAADKINSLEYEIFCEVRSMVAKENIRLQKVANAISVLDVLNSLANAAVKYNFCCPTIDLSDKIEIKDGRHPVVELSLKDTLFVPNDTILDCNEHMVSIITGPNMAGKSTYMRQVAIIVLLAQIGSFVPAQSARIGIVDKIFTRVGASDDLSAGKSTFMVEMSEVAYILKNATSKSLIIYDEIGRGTSTFDGMSIAKAVVEYSANKKKLGAKTLFATHYHELSELENEREGVKNYNIAVKKRGDDITFLRKIVRGGADDSYGIEVAILAGVPKEVIKRAREILKILEDGKFSTGVITPKNTNQSQPSFFDHEVTQIIDILKRTDATALTPIEAINKLYELTGLAKQV